VTKLKNVRAGIVIIADAGLKLAPGETVSVERPSPQMQRAVDAGLLARVDSESESKSKPKNAPKPEETKPEPTDGGKPAPEDPGTPAAETADPGKDDGATVDAAPGVKRGGK
jgi:hypothetical protein